MTVHAAFFLIGSLIFILIFGLELRKWEKRLQQRGLQAVRKCYVVGALLCLRTPLPFLCGMFLVAVWGSAVPGSVVGVGSAHHVHILALFVLWKPVFRLRLPTCTHHPNQCLCQETLLWKTELRYKNELGQSEEFLWVLFWQHLFSILQHSFRELLLAWYKNWLEWLYKLPSILYPVWRAAAGWRVAGVAAPSTKCNRSRFYLHF